MYLHLVMTQLLTQSKGKPPKAATLSGQLTQIRPAGRSPLQQTANDKLGTWQGHWDSPIHEGLHTWYTKQLISTWPWNFRVMLSDNVSLASWTWPMISYRISYPKSVYEISLFYILWITSISVKSDPISLYADIVFENIDIVPDIEYKPSISGADGWQRRSKLTFWPDIEYTFLRYRRKY